MKYQLKKNTNRLHGSLTLESSKSESNRTLIIYALAGGDISDIQHLSKSRDTQILLELLQHNSQVYDVKDAGTTMRFLTAYFALFGENSILTGTERMKNRPIGTLVDALRKLGASISYEEKEGYPPLKINRINEQQSNEIYLLANISSQYVSALLMIAPFLPLGLVIHLSTEIISQPYIQMTLDLMKIHGVKHRWKEQRIYIAPQVYKLAKSYIIEGDWSGASYWYSFLALSNKIEYLTLVGLRKHSTQGDQTIMTIMKNLGINTHFKDTGVRIEKNTNKKVELMLDFTHCPDLAQTVMVVAAASGTTLKMIGLSSLRIKETDRIKAMQCELKKIGA